MSALFLLLGGIFGLRYFLEHVPWDNRLTFSTRSMATKLCLFMVPLCLELAAVVDSVLNGNTGILRYLVVFEDI
jgi:hypothetical protein